MSIQWQIDIQKAPKINKYFALGLIIAGVACLILSFWQRNFILAILTILFVFVIFQVQRTQYKNHVFGISEQGVRLDEKLYPFHYLKSFWIFYEPKGIQELSLISKKNIMPQVKLPLYGQNPNEIRRFLLSYLPEKEQEESLIDILSHRLGF